MVRHWNSDGELGAASTAAPAAAPRPQAPVHVAVRAARPPATIDGGSGGRCATRPCCPPALPRRRPPPDRAGCRSRPAHCRPRRRPRPVCSRTRRTGRLRLLLLPIIPRPRPLLLLPLPPPPPRAPPPRTPLPSPPPSTPTIPPLATPPSTNPLTPPSTVLPVTIAAVDAALLATPCACVIALVASGTGIGGTPAAMNTAAGATNHIWCASAAGRWQERPAAAAGRQGAAAGAAGATRPPARPPRLACPPQGAAAGAARAPRRRFPQAASGR